VTSDRPPAPARTEPVRAPGMRRGSTQPVERWAVWNVDGIISHALGWHFREQPLPDYGVDAQAEVVADEELVTGRLVALQIKGGDSWFGEPADEWLGHSLPVVFVIVDTGGKAFWQVVTPATVRETPKGFALVIPCNQPFDVTARDKLLAIAGRSTGLVESIPAFYAVLPTNAVSPLSRAADNDRLASARLAERLASGRVPCGCRKRDGTPMTYGRHWPRRSATS
jgi:hypothetical protein